MDLQKMESHIKYKHLFSICLFPFQVQVLNKRPEEEWIRKKYQQASFSSLERLFHGPFSFCFRLLSAELRVSLYGLSGRGVSRRSQYMGTDMSACSVTSPERTEINKSVDY